MAKKFQEEKKGGLPGWMGTYGDLVTLLLCFFVLLFAMSSVDVTKFKAAISSFSNQIDIMPGGKALTGEELLTNGISQLSEIAIILNETLSLPDAEGDGTETVERDAEDILEEEYEEAKELAAQVKARLVEEGYEMDITVAYNPNSITVALQGEALFDVGEASIRPEAQDLLTSLGEMYLEEFSEFALQIEGHTDNSPINTTAFPDNHMLSFARANAVRRFFMTNLNILSEDMICTGYGEDEPFDPEVDNNLPQNRKNNRRVEIKYVLQLEEKKLDDIILEENTAME